MHSMVNFTFQKGIECIQRSLSVFVKTLDIFNGHL